MSVIWTPHRFTGGVLALDTANTVVLRHDASRSFDRFEDPAEIGRFAEAASSFRSAELGGRRLAAPNPTLVHGKVLAIREATDGALRANADAGSMPSGALQAMLASCVDGLDAHRYELSLSGRPFGDPSTPIAFEAALSVSALSLLAPERLGRIKICGNCGWLFLDSSRNSSRLWCDMAVCGNRQKARRHYKRHRGLQGEDGHGGA
ncbi:CGNR zinc finger domain-containing protein [Arvimicrobium flavum]|uniref:CGNR zinc finger domain-containing protein n=1 Tax=Arvimicrobium flavum TaxID=3393320 RepID=UPI00237C46E1|nr:CGNR zinc finger domain-containing protein [Mesorhizobium shangrilense]